MKTRWPQALAGPGMREWLIRNAIPASGRNDIAMSKPVATSEGQSRYRVGYLRCRRQLRPVRHVRAAAAAEGTGAAIVSCSAPLYSVHRVTVRLTNELRRTDWRRVVCRRPPNSTLPSSAMDALVKKARPPIPPILIQQLDLHLTEVPRTVG